MRRLALFFFVMLIAILFIPTQAVYAAGCGGLPDSNWTGVTIPAGTYSFDAGCVEFDGSYRVEAGTVTINGNGGALDYITILVDAGSTLNLNDITVMNMEVAIHVGGTVNITNSKLTNHFHSAITSGGNLTVIDSAIVNTEGWGIITDGGTATVNGSCFENNTYTHVMTGIDVNLQGNWWGSPNAPTIGTDDTFDIRSHGGIVDASNHLTTRPDSCNAPIIGDVPSNGAPDFRINWGQGDHYAIGYRGNTPNGRALVFWCTHVDGNGKFDLVTPPFVITPADVKNLPEEVEENYFIKEYHNDYCHLQFHLLTTGRFQLTMGPDENGNLHALIFDGLADSGFDHTVVNVLP